MRYLVDGYNFLFQICNCTSPLQNRRNALLDLLDRKLGFFKGKCTFIFDSAKTIRDHPQCVLFENLEVVYAPNTLSADTYIIECVEQSPSPQALTIVTSDGWLTSQCRQLGAHVATIDAFIALIRKKTSTSVEEKPQGTFSEKELERFRKIFEQRLKE